mmetsp:Transcript_28637/g.49123  ORF Transcript_28637/g.49123 Transcript_28637/m.49123 type:complete len:235 (+) Transcript_28637:1211-1915(+)
MGVVRRVAGPPLGILRRAEPCVLQHTMLPANFSHNLAQKILLIGKSINFIRLCLQKMPRVTAKDEEIDQPLFRDDNAYLHPRLFISICFCFSPPFPPGALRSSNAQFEPSYVLDRIGIRLLEASAGDSGWEIFSLDYSIDAPLNAIMHSGCISKYRIAFHMLWRLKRVEWSLATTWKQHTLFNHAHRAHIPPVLSEPSHDDACCEQSVCVSDVRGAGDQLGQTTGDDWSCPLCG